MFRKRYRQQIPELNTTSTADISFMLLIFFLVTSSMDTEKGLLRQMAPPPLEHEQPKDINRDHVLQVKLDANNQLTCDGKTVTYQQLTAEVRSMAFVNRTGHVVSIQADPATTYEAYFQMQDAIVSAYQELREEYAKKHYGRSYAACTSDEKAALNEYYPQRISESPIQEGGEP
jgi:biopolymer transport protein ExbD